MIEQGLAQYLSNDPTVSGIIAGRIYGGPLLPKNVVLPAVLYQIVASVPISSLGGENATKAKRFQFDSCARDYLTARRLSDAVRSALLFTSNGSGAAPDTSYPLPDGTFVQGVILHEDHDMGAEPGSGSGPEGYIYRALLDLQFIFTPSP
jgi:hypothetical protein